MTLHKTHKSRPGEWQASLARNHGKLCKAPNCHMPRDKVSSWCRKHDEIVRNYGHPDGFLIEPWDYYKEAEDASKFIDAHLAHPGIQSAIKWIQEWLESTATDDDEVVAKADMGRLYQLGVPPVVILKAVTAIWLYAHRNPYKLPDDIRLTFMLSIAALKTAPRFSIVNRNGNPRPLRYSAEGRKMVGRRIRDTLGLLLVNITETLSRIPLAKEKLKEDLALPFELSPTWVDSVATE